MKAINTYFLQWFFVRLIKIKNGNKTRYTLEGWVKPLKKSPSFGTMNFII
jgi:hypothetical protein